MVAEPSRKQAARALDRVELRLRLGRMIPSVVVRAEWIPAFVVLRREWQRLAGGWQHSGLELEAEEGAQLPRPPLRLREEILVAEHAEALQVLGVGERGGDTVSPVLQAKLEPFVEPQKARVPAHVARFARGCTVTGGVGIAEEQHEVGILIREQGLQVARLERVDLALVDETGRAARSEPVQAFTDDLAQALRISGRGVTLDVMVGLIQLVATVRPAARLVVPRMRRVAPCELARKPETR